MCDFFRTYAFEICHFFCVPLRLQRLIIINTMEQKAFQQYSDDEFRDALIATMNLKQEWMASVDKREKELGLR